MKVKELIEQLQQLNGNQDIYIPNELDLNEPVIQTISLKDDEYHLLVTY